MKIIIVRKVPASPINGIFTSNAIEYMRGIFAPLIEDCWIEEAYATSSGNLEETITAKIVPQGDANPVDIEPKIRSALAVHNDLTLKAIEGVRNHIKLSGLKFISQNPQGEVTYEVNPIFAHFLATDLTKALFCSQPRVYAVDFMFEETGDSLELIHTGSAIVLTDNKLIAQPLNAFNKVAKIILYNEPLRFKILNNMFERLFIILKTDGTTRLSYLERELAPTHSQPALI